MPAYETEEFKDMKIIIHLFKDMGFGNDDLIYKILKVLTPSQRELMLIDIHSPRELRITHEVYIPPEMLPRIDNWKPMFGIIYPTPRDWRLSY